MAITPNLLKAELNGNGWRMTPQREKIFQIFQTLPKGEHLSVRDLQTRLVAAKAGISLSTINRTVRIMARMGVLRELELAEGCKLYELNNASPHHHIVCSQCSRTIEFNNDSILKQSLRQAEKSGLHLVDCQLTIYTVCPEALRMGYPALPEHWKCSHAIAQTSSSLK